MLYLSPNGEFPKYAGDIQVANPSWSIGDALPEGWFEVAQTEPPELAADERVDSTEAVLVNGQYEIKWNVRAATAEEIAAAEAPRTAREKLVALGFSADEIKAIAKGLVE